LTGKNRSNRRQPVPLPLCAPQTPHAPATNRNCAPAIRCIRSATRATTQSVYFQIYLRKCPGIEFRWGTRFSAPVQTSPGTHPASSTVCTGSFPGVKSVRGVMLTPHPLLVPRSRNSRAISLLPLWAVRPVQSLSACTRVHFTFTF
jgi:hypothetical protein